MSYRLQQHLYPHFFISAIFDIVAFLAEFLYPNLVTVQQTIKIYFSIFLSLFICFGFTQIKRVEATGIQWNTFLGGSSTDSTSYQIVNDNNGNIYITGPTGSIWGTPLSPYSSGLDGYLAKFDTNGNLLWHTYFGGAGDDYAYAITIDSSGNIYVGGYSNVTWGNPIRAYSAGIDSFIVKFDGNGNRLWSTFLGGNGNENILAMVLDNNGGIYASGYANASWGTPINTFNGGYDMTITKINIDGSVVWNTFLGCSGNDLTYGGLYYSNGAIFVDGYSSGSWGTPINAYTGSNDVVVAKIDANSGTLAWHTFLGGSGFDVGAGIITDTTGNIYISGGSAASWGNPIHAYTTSILDAFVAKLNSDGILQWHTFVGGPGNDNSAEKGISLNSNGDIYLVGYSDATWGTPLQPYTGGRDGFVAKFDNGGNLLWNSFQGSSGNDYNRSITADTHGNLYVGGFSLSAEWGTPIRNYTAGQDGYVFKIDDGIPTTTDNIRNTAYNSDVTITLSCTDNLYGSGCKKTYYSTDGNNPTTSSAQGNTVTLSAEGTYTIKYFSEDNTGNFEAVKTATNTVKIDKTPPPKATIKSIGKIRNIPDKDTLTYYFTEQNPQIQGTAEENSTVKFTVGGNTYATVADSQGNYSIRIQDPLLSRGNNVITYFVTDAAGNNSENRTLTLIIGEENFPSWLLPEPQITEAALPIVTVTPTVTSSITNSPQPTILPISTETRIQILDNSKAPLANSEVKVDGVQYTTDAAGYVQVKNMKEGTHILEAVLGTKVVQVNFVIDAVALKQGKIITMSTTNSSAWWLLLLIVCIVTGVYIYTRSRKNSIK